MLDLRLRWLKLQLINEPTTTTRLDMVTIILFQLGVFFVVSFGRQSARCCFVLFY